MLLLYRLINSRDFKYNIDIVMRYTFLIFLFISGISHSQTNIWDENPIDSQEELDSLLTILPNVTGENRMPYLNRIAEIYWLILPDKTLEYAGEALQLSLEFNDKSQEGLALINLCQGYLVNDIYDKALDFGLQSLEIRKELGNEYDLAFTLRTLGWLYYDIGYYDKALEYHKETLQLALPTMPKTR